MNVEIIKDNIQNIQKEIGFSNHSSFFEFLSQKMDGMLNDHLYPIDVFVSSEINKSHLKSINELNISKKYRFNIFQSKASILCNKYDNLLSSLALVILDTTFDNEVIIDFFSLRASSYSNIFVINLSGIDSQNNLANHLVEQAKYKLVNEVNELSKLADYLDVTFSTKELEAIKELSVLKTIDPIIIYLGEIIKSESQLLQTRKIILSQDANNARKNESINNLSELNNNIRQIIQKNLIELERSFKTKYEELNKNRVGTFSIMLNNILDSFKYESMDKLSVARKTESFETRVSDLFINDFLKKVTQVFKLEAEKDIQYINNVIEASFEKINGNLKQKNIEKLTVNNIIKPDLNVNNLIDTHVYIQKTYVGELTKEGIMEYFVALRDYTGMIMIVVGIFGPLTLLSADSDAKKESALYFLTVISKFLKPVKSILQLITIVLILSMLIYGFFDLRVRIPNKRIEEKERDLDKAKESLQSEGKRIFNELSRDWNSSLSLFLKDYTQNIQNELDQIIKSHLSKNMQAQQVKKNNQGLEQTNLELKLKSVTTAERLFETLQRKLGDMKLSALKI